MSTGGLAALAQHPARTAAATRMQVSCSADPHIYQLSTRLSLCLAAVSNLCQSSHCQSGGCYPQQYCNQGPSALFTQLSQPQSPASDATHVQLRPGQALSPARRSPGHCWECLHLACNPSWAAKVCSWLSVCRQLHGSHVVPIAGMQAGTLRRPGLLAVEPSPFAGGEPRIRVRLEVEGDWDEAAVAERRQSHGEASTSGGDQSPRECSSDLKWGSTCIALLWSAAVLWAFGAP